MLNKKIKPVKLTSLLGLSIITNLMVVSFVTPARANKTIEKSTKSNKVMNSNYGLPTHRRDGGSRSSINNCLADADNRNLIALVPDKTVGISTSISPKIFFYVPEVSRQKTLEFVLRSEQDELIYEAFMTTKGKGIMSIEIPINDSLKILETDQNYHWYLSIICNSEQRSRDIVVEGWIRQEMIDYPTEQKLNLSNSVEKAELYNEQGFWYDALSVLAENRNSRNQEPMIKTKWSELMNSVGLAELAAEPFIESELIETSASSQ